MALEDLAADTFPKLLLRNANQRGGRPAFREKKRGIWHTKTWREQADEVTALAAALSARGLQRGSHVALLGDNRPRLYAAMCAAQWLGAVVVPLYQDASAGELVAPIQSAEVTDVFAENQEQVDKLIEILPRCPSIRRIVYDKDRGMRHYKHPQLISYDALLQEGSKLAANPDALHAEAARGKADDAAFVFFTSGTTGAAKGVVLTHGALIDRARVAASASGLTENDLAIAYLSPGWIAQNLFSYVHPLVVGYCVCCPESSDTLVADMREMGPTYLLATPRVLDTLLTQVLMRFDDTGRLNRALYRRGLTAAHRMEKQAIAGDKPSIGDRIVSKVCDIAIFSPLRDMLGMSNVRAAYTAGDAIDPELLMFFRTFGINLKQLYGSTETGFFVSLQRDGEAKPDTVGRLAEGVEIKFTPQREVLVRSPGLFKEYHRDPEATKQAKGADGWFHTGDIGRLGDDGHLRIVDRAKDISALSDGTPFAPKPIENKLRFPSFIKEAVVFGEKRDKVCALIDIDMTAVGRWADRQTITYIGHADLASRDEVYGLIGATIAKVNAELAKDPALSKSQIRRFAILQKDLTADDGFLTRTGKLRRDVVAERFKPVIDAMYDGRDAATFGAGGEQAAAELKIRNVDAAPPAQGRKAA
jgi:long-chain acyl-CoA synthetase